MAEPLANQLELDLQRLSVGILYLMVDRAVLDFPTSTAAHPSDWVFVNRSVGALLREGDGPLFPFKVRWHVWENLVVPIWNNPNLRVKLRGILGPTPKNLLLLQLGQLDLLLSEIRAALAAQAGSSISGAPLVVDWSADPLVLNLPTADPVGGYIPKQPATGIVPTPEADGEPVNPVGTGNPNPWMLGFKYQVFDEDG